MTNHNQLFLRLCLLLLLASSLQAQKLLLVPEVLSKGGIRTVERIAKIMENTGVKVGVLLHEVDVPSWKEPSITVVHYGSADELVPALQVEGTVREDAVISQIERSKILKSLSYEKYDVLVCNAKDTVCNYIDKNSQFDKRIYLINTCPSNWQDIFGDMKAPSLFGSIKQKLFDFVLSFGKSKYKNINYKPDALYLSECFQPLYNPKPDLKNLFPVGSFLGDQPKGQLPDHYTRPVLLANKIIFVSLSSEVPHYEQILLQTFKNFPEYLFVVSSEDFQMGDYALGNVIVDNNVNYNDILANKKTAVVISNGEWSLLLNTLFHGIPVVTLGMSDDGYLGRELIKEKKVGVSLTSKAISSEVLQDTIRDVLFGSAHQQNLKDISRYLKGQNNNYLIPSIMYNFFAAKGQANEKQDL